MIYVAIVALAMSFGSVMALSATIRSLTRSHARREDLLINQLCNAVGRPWQPAPADEWEEPEEPVHLYAVSPEQFPDDFDWEDE